MFLLRSMVSPISYEADVAMYMSADGFQQNGFCANYSCDFKSNITDESAIEGAKFQAYNE